MSTLIDSTEWAADLDAEDRLVISCVIPCCNEEEALVPLAARLATLREYLSATVDLHFVLVDDGSCDRTWEVMHDEFGGWNNVQLIRHRSNRGIGAAIQTGIEAADSELVCTLDADGTYDPFQIVQLLELWGPDVDLVTASPYHPQGRVEDVAPWRLFLSRGASWLYRRVLRTKLHTYTSCFRLYRRSRYLDLPLKEEGFLAVAEVVWRFDQRNAVIRECPAVLRSRQQGVSKMRGVPRIMLGHLRLLRQAWREQRSSAPGRVSPAPFGNLHLQRRKT